MAIDHDRIQDHAVVLMALHDFRAYTIAKEELYMEKLAEFGDTWPAPVPDRGAIDAWKARIRKGDDHYPGDAIDEGWKALADQRRAARKAHARKTGVFPKRDPLGGSTT